MGTTRRTTRSCGRSTCSSPKPSLKRRCAYALRRRAPFHRTLQHGSSPNAHYPYIPTNPTNTPNPAYPSTPPHPPNRCVFQYPLRPKSKPEVDAPRAAEVRFRYEHEMAQMEYDVETEGANYDQHAPSVQQTPRRRLCSTTVPLRTQYGKRVPTVRNSRLPEALPEAYPTHSRHHPLSRP